MSNALRSPRTSTSTPSVGELVRQALHDSSYQQLREITVREMGRGYVRLEGRVPTYYLKIKAQALAASVTGVFHLENAIVVQRAQVSSGSASNAESPLVARHLQRTSEWELDRPSRLAPPARSPLAESEETEAKLADAVTQHPGPVATSIATLSDSDLNCMSSADLIEVIRLADLPPINGGSGVRLEFLDRRELQRMAHLARRCCRHRLNTYLERSGIPTTFHATL